MKILLETDWLNTKPVFYNQKLNKASFNINDVIDWDDVQINISGLRVYLDYGFSAYGKTPVQGVTILPPCSKVMIDSSGTLLVEQIDDPLNSYEDYHLSEEEIIKLMGAIYDLN